MGTSDQNGNKRIEPALATALASLDDDASSLPVLIRLKPSPSRLPADVPTGSERGKLLESRLRQEAAEVLKILEQHAASDVVLLWVSGSISARASKAAIVALAAVSEVDQIQLVRRVHALTD